MMDDDVDDDGTTFDDDGENDVGVSRKKDYFCWACAGMLDLERTMKI